jgi:hypothetical protein
MLICMWNPLTFINQLQFYQVDLFPTFCGVHFETMMKVYYYPNENINYENRLILYYCFYDILVFWPYSAALKWHRCFVKFTFWWKYQCAGLRSGTQAHFLECKCIWNLKISNNKSLVRCFNVSHLSCHVFLLLFQS